MTDTMIEKEIAPKEYFAPFTPLTKEFFDVFGLTDSLFTWPRLYGERMVQPLRIEQYADQGYLFVRAELPGVDPEKDVKVTFEEGGVYIQAERKKEVDVRPPGEYFTEMRYGWLKRFVPLPKGVTEKDVTATYKNGILELRIALPAEAVTGPVGIPIGH